MASIHTVLEQYFLARGDQARAQAVRRMAEELRQPPPPPPAPGG